MTHAEAITNVDPNSSAKNSQTFMPFLEANRKPATAVNALPYKTPGFVNE